MITQSYQVLIQCGMLLVWSKQGCLLQKLFTFEGWTLIHYDFPYYEYEICIYPRWTVLIIHLPLKVRVCIPARVIPNHIFIPCRRSVVLHLNLSKMRVGSCKIWFGQSSCHPHWLCISLVSRTQNGHIPFMTIHCNMEWWWGMPKRCINIIVRVAYQQKGNKHLIENAFCNQQRPICKNISTFIVIGTIVQLDTHSWGQIHETTGSLGGSGNECTHTSFPFNTASCRGVDLVFSNNNLEE